MILFKHYDNDSDKNAFYGKPFALLLPAYTATKSYWREFVTEMETKTEYKGTNIQKSRIERPGSLRFFH